MLINIIQNAHTEIIIIIIIHAKIKLTLNIKDVAGALYKNMNYSRLSVSSVSLTEVVLTSRRNDCSEGFALADDGRAFQAAASEKAQSPSVAC